MEILIKEETNGSVYLECYYKGELDSLVVLSIDPDRIIGDIITYTIGWDWFDACEGYSTTDNTTGGKLNGRLLTAKDMSCDTDTVIAEYTQETLTLHIDRMGAAGMQLFNINLYE